VTNFLLLLIINSLIIWGIYCVFSEGYLLEKVGEFIRKDCPKWVIKMLFGCPPCMSSLYGSVVAVVVYDFHSIVIAYILALCGLNFIIKSILYPEYEDGPTQTK
jgi:hypothetical protein